MKKELKLVTLLLILIDLLICQLALFGSLYDTNLPSPSSSSTPVLQSLTTAYRLTCFWASILIRVYFILETGTRIYFNPLILKTPLSLLDMLVVIIAVPLKLSLSARDALVLNFFIIIRLFTFGANVNEFMHFSASCKTASWHQEELRKNAEVQRDLVMKELEEVKEKMRVMTGEVDVLYDQNNDGKISPDRFSKLSFFNT